MLRDGLGAAQPSTFLIEGSCITKHDGTCAHSASEKTLLELSKHQQSQPQQQQGQRTYYYSIIPHPQTKHVHYPDQLIQRPTFVAMSTVYHDTVHPEFAEWQQIVIVVSGAITGFLSLMSSATILCLIIADLDRKFAKVKYRFLLGLSVADAIGSITFMVWSLPVPQNSPNVWGALGNDTTCAAQGFVLQLSTMGAFYNAALSHFFYRSICHGTSDDEYYFSGWELGWHIVGIFIPCITALLGVAMGVANFTSVGCWYGPHPPGCLHDDAVECIRGENGFVVGWLFVGVPTCALLVVVGWCMWKIQHEVATVVERVKSNSGDSTWRSSKAKGSGNDRNTAQEGTECRDKLRKGAHDSSQTEDGNLDGDNGHNTDAADHSTLGLEQRVKEVAQQAYWYFAIYFITHVFGFPMFFMESVGLPQQFWLSWLLMVTYPSQGMGNLFIFIRPRVLNVQRKYPSYTYANALYASIFRYDQLLSVSEQISSGAASSQIQSVVEAIGADADTATVGAAVGATVGVGGRMSTGVKKEMVGKRENRRQK